MCIHRKVFFVWYSVDFLHSGESVSWFARHTKFSPVFLSRNWNSMPAWDSLVKHRSSHTKGTFFICYDIFTFSISSQRTKVARKHFWFLFVFSCVFVKTKAAKPLYSCIHICKHNHFSNCALNIWTKQWHACRQGFSGNLKWIPLCVLLGDGNNFRKLIPVAIKCFCFCLIISGWKLQCLWQFISFHTISQLPKNQHEISDCHRVSWSFQRVFHKLMVRETKNENSLFSFHPVGGTTLNLEWGGLFSFLLLCLKLFPKLGDDCWGSCFLPSRSQTHPRGVSYFLFWKAFAWDKMTSTRSDVSCVSSFLENLLCCEKTSYCLSARVVRVLFAILHKVAILSVSCHMFHFGSWDEGSLRLFCWFQV